MCLRTDAWVTLLPIDHHQERKLVDRCFSLLFSCVAFSEVWSDGSRAEHQDVLNSGGKEVNASSKDFSCSHLILSAGRALVLVTVV